MMRVGEWKTSAKAVLKGYKLVFNVKSPRWGGMTANVRKSPSSQDIVYGVIYLMPESKLGVLTEYEGNEPKSVTVESEGQQLSAKVYIFPTTRTSERPPDSYLNSVLMGLQQHGYQEEIVEKVRHIAENA